jgi:hypothetical protein
MRQVKLWVIAIASFLFAIAGEGLVKRAIALSMCGILSFNSLTCMATLGDSSRANAALPANPHEVNQASEQLSPPVAQAQKVAGVCLFGICAPVNLPKPVENLIQGELDKTVQNQLRSLLADQIPISGSDHKFYPSVTELPGAAFAPQTLYLTDLSPKTPIPAGDYEIPVHFYCTGVYSFNGRGNRFALAQLKGRMAEALSALYARTSYDSSAPINEIQTLAWAMQSGMAYTELADPQKALVDKYIPEYRESMQRSFIDRLTGISGDVSRISGGRIPNITQVLDKLGPVGDVTQSLLRAREQMLRTNYSHQPLAQEFSPQKDFFLEGGVEKTPWSRVQDNVYMRSIAPQGAMHDGKVQVRILNNGSRAADGSYQVAQASPLLAASATNGTITSEALLNQIVQSVGVSEGSGGQATQPQGARKCPVSQSNRTNPPSRPQIIYLNVQGNNDIKFYCSRDKTIPPKNCPQEGFITLETVFDIFDIYDPSGSPNSQRNLGTYRSTQLEMFQQDYTKPIIEILQAIYKGFNIQFTTQRPVGVSYSTVNIIPDADRKVYSQIVSSQDVANQQLEDAGIKLAGIAETAADCGNSNNDDNAVIFASSRDGKGTSKSKTEIALTIAHEVGHLLGLSHDHQSTNGVVLPTSLMEEGGCRGQMPCELSSENKKILEMNVGIKK